MGEGINRIRIIPIFAAMKPWLHIVLAFFLLGACSKPNVTPSPEEDMLYRVECFFQSRPDSAMQIIDTLDIGVLSKKEQAHHALLRALLINNRKKYGAELDSLVQVARDQFIGGDDKYHEAWTYWLMSNKSTNMQQPKQIALDAVLNAKKSIEKCRHVDPRLVQFAAKPTDEQTVIDNLKYFIYLELGMTYTASVYFAEAIPPLRLADAYFAKMEDHFNRESSAISLAYSYLLMQEFDSSLAYFQKALFSAEALGFSDDIAHKHHSIASYYNFKVSGEHYESEAERQSFLDKAIEEINAGFACLTDTSDYSYGYVKQSLLEGLAETYYYMQQYDSCLFYGEQAIDAGRSADRFFEDYELYRQLYESCKALGDEKKAVVYADMMQAMEHPEAHMREMAEVKDEFEKQEELLQQETEYQRRSRWLYGLVALLVIGLALLGVMVRLSRRRKAAEADRQIAEAHDALKVKALEVVMEKSKALYAARPRTAWKEILAEFNAAFPEVMPKVERDHPDLTEGERNVALLSFLGFRIKEEATLLHLSENTVMKYRSNLKKKVGFDPILAMMD